MGAGAAIIAGGAALGLMEGVANYQAAKDKAEALDDQAFLANQRGKEILRRANLNVEALKVDQALALGNTAATSAAQGASGDVLLQIGLDTARRVTEEEEIIMEEARFEINNANKEASMLRSQAADTRRAGRIGIGTSILSGAAGGAKFASSSGAFK